MKKSTAPSFTIKNTTVYFEPIDNLPGFTHRVAIVRDGVRIAKGWLKNEYVPSKTSARYFYKKLCLGQDNEAILQRAKKREIKPPVYSKPGFAQWLEERMFEPIGEMGTYRTPIDVYIDTMKESDKWSKGSFLYDGAYRPRPRWMYRFKNYCASHGRGSISGVEVRTILHSKVWDNKQYD